MACVIEKRLPHEIYHSVVTPALRGESFVPFLMATLWRAWRVVARRHGRPFQDGLVPPSAAATTAAAEARDRKGLSDSVKTNVTHRGYPTGQRVLGHHRGPPTMAYLVELHVTPDIVKHPPGGRCDVLVEHVGDAHDGEVHTVIEESNGPTKNSGYQYVVRVTPPSKNDPKHYSRLVMTYTAAMDAAWGISGGVASMENMHGETDQSAATTNHEKEKTFGALAVPLLGVEESAGGIPSVNSSISAACEAVSGYEVPLNLRLRNHETDWHVGEVAPVLGASPFSVKLCAPDEQIAKRLERQLETHLGQSYLPTAVVTREFN